MAVQTTTGAPLKTQSYVVLAFLAVQFVLGMLTNLFVAFPDGYVEGRAWQYAWSQIPSATHILVGFGLVISAIVFLVRALRLHAKFWVNVAIAGLVGIVIAAGSGALFVGTQKDIYSLTMSLGFLLAFASYAYAAFKTTD